MTQAEMMVLQKGRIPARIVLDEIRSFVGQFDGEEIEGGLLEGVAAKGGLSYDTIITWLGQERVQSIDFDVADRILLYVVGPTWGRDPRFEEYYYGVDLSWRRCECPGCEVMFQPVHAAEGVTGQRYCSTACQRAAKKIRRGESKRRQKHYRGTATTCRNGHPRTPENTRIRKNGKRECAACARIANRASYHQRKQRSAA